MPQAGPFTACDLNNLQPLDAPWTDKNGILQPVFSQQAALLSFELAAAAYDLNLEAWQEAGWRDFSYQVDNTLLTGPALNNRGNGGIGGMLSDYLHFLARSRAKRLNPVSQLRGALRQREKADTCKAVVMLHPLPFGRYLVAVGFMGTGKRIYDWFSNFRLNRQEGMHAGFLQLTKEFENNLASIAFPDTARELGLDRLTLADILQDCRKPCSRFRLWMAGHSQGGAIMQLFAFRAIRQGFLRQHMIGYTFASPSVVYDHPKCDLQSFPLFHIINAQDIFPRMGARWHVGRCRVFFPDAAMRSACCRVAWNQPVFRAIAPVMRQVSGSDSAFLVVGAMLRALEDVPAEDAMTVLNGLIGSVVPDKVLEMLGSRREEIVSALIRRVDQGYAVASGGDKPPEAALRVLRGQILGMIRTYGAAAFSKAALQNLSLPHKLKTVPGGNGTAPYLYIVTKRFSDLRAQTWCAPSSRMNPPSRTGIRTRPGGRFAGLSAERNRR